MTVFPESQLEGFHHREEVCEDSCLSTFSDGWHSKLRRPGRRGQGPSHASSGSNTATIRATPPLDLPSRQCRNRQNSVSSVLSLCYWGIFPEPFGTKPRLFKITFAYNPSSAWRNYHDQISALPFLIDHNRCSSPEPNPRQGNSCPTGTYKSGD